MPLSHFLCVRAVVLQIFCRWKAAVVLRKVAEDLLFHRSQYGSFTIFAAVPCFVIGPPEQVPIW